MKRFDRLILIILMVNILIFVGVNMFFSNGKIDGQSREYRVEISRLAEEIKNGNEPDVSNCRYVFDVVVAEADNSDFYNSNNDYVIKNINGRLYRFDYRLKDNAYDNVIIILNIILIAVSFLMLIVLLYLRKQIIRPFNKLSDIPYELAKGNLTVPIKENKNRFLGKFTWGLDMLREKLEDDRRKELSLQKEKQTLLLSISHDIKTPLSAIKLYSYALSKGIYEDEEKKKEVILGIGKKVDEIENYVSDLTNSVSDDFLNLEVKKGDFYLSDLMENINDYYKDKLLLNKIEFEKEDYNDCILEGDFDRCIEVLQNVFENAIKYGDGKKIAISFSDEEDCRLVTVKNSGCELPESEVVHIFDSFWRGSNSDKKSGSGLGLYICKKLMHMMGGDIYARIDEDNMLVTVVFKRG